ncbi:MAG: DUF1109 domain-containing protein [Alphaproteobacteria bacterium]|nr:DUF1109 domain-containing protein [Alphaproteobacteria bacterium]
MTGKTDTTLNLIAQLSAAAPAHKRAVKPRRLALYLLAVFTVYALGAQAITGLRPDVTAKLTDIWFLAEITSLLCLALASAAAGIMLMAPDAFQKPTLLKLPYIVFAVIMGLIISQYTMAIDITHPVVGIETQGLECALCLAGLSAIPSALMFAVIKHGATVHPFQAGAFSVFTAAGIGCLTLRLAEQTDNMMHLALWHYLPTLLFAMLGAFIGKLVLKW